MKRLVPGRMWRRSGHAATERIARARAAAIGFALLLPTVAQADAPPGRAYEQVTPIFKNGAEFGAGVAGQGFSNAPGPVARDGDRVLATSVAGFGDPASQLGVAAYLFVRNADGWQTRPLAPQPPPAHNPIMGQPSLDILQGFSTDLSVLAFRSNYVLDTVRDLDRGGAGGDADVYRVGPDGSVELASCPAPPASPCAAQVSVPLSVAGGRNAVSADGSRLVFELDEPFATGGTRLFPGANGEHVYERAGDELRWVSQPLDQPLAEGETDVGVNPSVLEATGANGFYGRGGATGSWPNAISPDGSRVFFVAFVPPGNQQARLYVRIDGRETLEVSRVRGGTGPALGITPKGASSDGNRAFFSTAQALLPASGGGGAEIDPHQTPVADLYAWQYDPDTGSESLTRVTGLPLVGGGPPLEDQRFENVLGASSDGSRLYFISRSQVFSAASPGSVNLYVADNPTDPANGTVRFIATVFTGTTFNVNNSTCLVGASPAATCSRATPDGRFLAFQSRLPVTGDDRDTDGTTTCDTVSGAIPEVCRADTFRYDADSGTIVRATIGADGPNGARGNASGGVLPFGCANNDTCPFDATMGAHQGQTTYALNLSGNGSLFFQTAESLVPADENDKLDVYGFVDGAVQLISPGQGPEHSVFMGNSADGRDVFFVTVEGLVPQDGDGAPDIYDARVGGGFPVQEEPRCDPIADACQGPPAAAVLRSPVDSMGRGGADLALGPRARIAIRGLSAAARRRAARTGILRVRVRSTVPGRVSARARARLRTRRGVRTRRVANAGARVVRPGTVTLSLRLSKPARRQLRTRRSLRVSLRVTLPGARARSRTVRLRLPKRTSEPSERARNAR